MEKLVKHIEGDNQRVNLKFPTIEVRYKNLCLEATCEVIDGKPLPTLWNATKSLLQAKGEVTYNGFSMEEFIPEKTSAYISQNDLHIPEMTVRETIDFSARCQGVGSRSDTIVGDAMRRGISGGQKKRLTTGEMIVGPTRALFMDEISTGLDSSTTFQIVTFLQQLVHITEVTALVSLLQPAPETFDLFDDIVLMAEGKTIYHGPRIQVLEFFQDCGFKCPERKGVSDFLQEVISRKDQAQYWCHADKPYAYVTADHFRKKFKESPIGRKLEEELSKNYDKSQSHKSALSFTSYSLTKWDLFKACMAREVLLLKRNLFIYAFRIVQLTILALITMTVFLRTQMEVDLPHSVYYMGVLFYTLIRMLTNGIQELILTVHRLQVFYKHRDFFFYPAWAYSIPASIISIPFSLVESSIWTAVTYYGIGYSPQAARFFGQFFLLFVLHQASTSMFRFIGSIIQDTVVGFVIATMAIQISLLFGGFILPRCRMVLPFKPLTVVFDDIQYFVDTPQEMKEEGITERRLQLLSDITGALRPGILTALMGVSGAGKTTLMDVLCGRKTTGTVEGDIRIGGYPKFQETFARIFGYCEQNDIHSPQITVEESAFVKKVLETIELDVIKDSLVGIPGFNGLSTEQRKRLTIAVELVANPSIMFMDEPTSGLDARAAAIVMRAVKNVVNTGRTVVCTIHQPSIDIFEAFDEMILMKRGGQIIYSGPLGQHSSKLIEYFELGVDFAHLYRESLLYRNNKEMVKKLSKPPIGSEDLHFSTRYPQSGWEQFKACLWKQHLSYWRNPAYNLMRIIYLITSSVLIGAVFWKHGKRIDDNQDVFNISGAMFVSIMFLGLNNCMSILPFIDRERPVFYRERFAGMYSSWSYSSAQIIIEIPYIFLLTVIFTMITYPAIGFHWSFYKVVWYFYAMFSTLLYFNYFGMLLMALTPNIQKIPKWWIWCYWISPASWTMNGLLTSQYGDMHKEITVFEKQVPINTFLREFYNFHHDRLAVVAVVLAAYSIVFASLFAFCIGKLNFQRR
ncbi:Pleiotropic drug resistance protein 3 [Acorus calamus]|uniref:Pleiotropic drug resistance protein 3 n=1 Tax=Acorus calamus TaxID=4465 RepID=A0AAV9F0H9_ACOCL|nr:Pleiotropic drug resistance protein 3 [Acorus calamus]